jgi:hypothetical protein
MFEYSIACRFSLNICVWNLRSIMELSIEKWCDLSENPGEPHSYFRGLEHMPVQRPQTHVELV